MITITLIELPNNFRNTNIIHDTKNNKSPEIEELIRKYFKNSEDLITKLELRTNKRYLINNLW